MITLAASAFQIAISSVVSLVEISIFGMSINEVRNLMVAEETLFLYVCMYMYSWLENHRMQIELK